MCATLPLIGFKNKNMDNQKQSVAAAIKEANNVLVTVSANPSVDQLAACIGLTLALNKLGKHATAVFSGAVPSTIEFLQPEKTLEKNTDSLRDFIIALDRSKADKLRYKLEDDVVKIFITPYKTSISEKDLEYSQGDFNVDVVVAIGVLAQAELDQAITAHGRILHDAKVLMINMHPGEELGMINWLDPGASSLSELVTQLVIAIDKKLIDGQIATSFLTGIVAETDRFSNAQTTPQTMSIAAELMSAGANQQLVATKLEEPAPPPPEPPLAHEDVAEHDEPVPMPKHGDDGTLEIGHEPGEPRDEAGQPAEPAAEASPQEGPSPEGPQPQAGQTLPDIDPNAPLPDMFAALDHPDAPSPYTTTSLPSFGAPVMPAPSASPEPEPEPEPDTPDTHMTEPEDLPRHVTPWQPPEEEPEHKSEDHADEPKESHVTPDVRPEPEPETPDYRTEHRPEPAPDTTADHAESSDEARIDEAADATPTDEAGKPGDTFAPLPDADLLPEPKHEEFHKSDRPYLGGPNHTADGDSRTLLGVPTDSPMSATVMPDGFVTRGEDEAGMPLLERQPLIKENTTANEHSIAPTIMPPSEEGTSAPAKGRDLPPLEGESEVDTDQASPVAAAPHNGAHSADTNPTESADKPAHGEQTLSQIEKDVNSPHLSAITPYEPLDSDPARKASETKGHHAETADHAAASDAQTAAIKDILDASASGVATPEPANAAPASLPITPAPDIPAADESAVNAKTEQLPDSPTIDDARSAVERAISAMAADAGPLPAAAPDAAHTSVSDPTSPIKGASGIEIVPVPGDDDAAGELTVKHDDQPAAASDAGAGQKADPSAPPPGPPPMMPPAFTV